MMHTIPFSMRLSALLLAFPLLLGAVSPAAQPERPNILIILADDLGYADVGFQGSKHVITPHLDKLAASGTVCTDAHVTASVCSPSRAGLITGRFQQRFGHEANCPPSDKGMDVREHTMGQAFQAMGYRTAIIGKWHLGNSKARFPTRRGFDTFIGLREGSRRYWHNPKRDDKKGNPHAIEHNDKTIAFDGYLTDRFGDWGADFVKQKSDKPFFLFLSFTAPHGPLEAKPEDLKKLGTKNNYHAMIHAMDRAIGHVVGTLETTGQLDNTLIWFLSDNGGTCAAASNAPLAGKKGTAFEGGFRVPFLVYWKGHVPAGKRYGDLVSALDIFPTSLKAAGGELPADRPLDGTDILPHLTGKKSGALRKDMYWRRMNIAAAREGALKLIRVEDVGYALYDLSKDVGESRNLAVKHPDALSRLRKKLENWENDMSTPLWREGKKWDTWRADFHRKIFESSSSGEK